jgi:hypothetical protein
VTSPAPGAALRAGAVRTLACPSCGAAIALRAAGWTQTVACSACTAVLDAADPSLRVLRRAEERVRVSPRLPLGARGTLPAWRGVPHEVIGFQLREIRVDDVPYTWGEYVLFNPYHGFRYLTEYDGHWSDVVALPMLVEQGEARWADDRAARRHHVQALPERHRAHDVRARRVPVGGAHRRRGARDGLRRAAAHAERRVRRPGAHLVARHLRGR